MPLDGPEIHANASNPRSGTSGPPAAVRRFAWSEGLSRGTLPPRSARRTKSLPERGHTRLEKGKPKLTVWGY